jgi:CBS domain-containing protein/sporulation protein YlmC with PRC-barrel domain
MIYLSYLQRTPVADLDGEKIGQLEDVIAAKRGDLPHPVLVAIVVRCLRKQLIIPLTNITALAAPIILLNRVLSDVSPYEPGERDLYLVRDVLDKQIIDTDGMRVVRVNDLELARVNGNYYIANADIGILGLLRRLGMAKSFQRIAHRLHLSIPSDLIAWHHIDLLPDSRSMRLKVSSDRLSELHPADLAEILSDLSSGESSMILETLEVEKLADTLEEVEPEFQASLVKSMPDEKVADVLEEMAPDEAADLLAQLPEDRSHDLLELMEEDEAEEVRNLLKYPEDSAGGIMNTEYVAIRPELTAEQAIAALRESANKAETFFYIYVTDEENQLAGVFSLQDLVLAQPNTPVKTFMHKRLISIDVTCGQEEVAQMVTKYNLLAIPVVDEQHKLLGIVTADDALDKIIPTAWKKRLPRMYR